MILHKVKVEAMEGFLADGDLKGQGVGVNCR